MLKYLGTPTITFSEFPDQIAICVNITGCPCMCDNCSEPELRPDVGTELTEKEIDRIIKEHPGAGVFGLMGGDRDHIDVIRIAQHVHSKGLKVGMYSGMDTLDINLLNCLDFYKIGRWIMPQGDVSTWHKQNCGPLTFPWSNQLYFEKTYGGWFNATDKFRRKPLNDLKKQIIQ